MIIKDLKQFLDECDEEAELVISEAVTIDKDEEIYAVVDCPIRGVLYDEDTKELRFLLNVDDAKSCFPDKPIIELPF